MKFVCRRLVPVNIVFAQKSKIPSKIPSKSRRENFDIFEGMFEGIFEGIFEKTTKKRHFDLLTLVWNY